eukprot:g12003.t1
MSSSNDGGSRAERDQVWTVPPLTTNCNNNGDGAFPRVPIDVESPSPVDGGDPQDHPTDNAGNVVLARDGAEVINAHGAVDADMTAGGGIQAPRGTVSGAHEIASGGGIILPEAVVSMMRPFVSGSSGPVVTEGENRGVNGGGTEYRITLSELTVTRRDNSNASRPVDVEANLAAGVGGGGAAAAQGPIDGRRVIPAGDDHDPQQEVPEEWEGSGGTNRHELAVVTMLLVMVFLCAWLAGYARTPEALVVVLFALLSVAIDFLHRLDIIEMSCMQGLGISSSAVEAGIYSFTLTCFAGLGIGGLVAEKPR